MNLHKVRKEANSVPVSLARSSQHRPRIGITLHRFFEFNKHFHKITLLGSQKSALIHLCQGDVANSVDAPTQKTQM